MADYVDSNLLPNEQVVYRTQLHSIIYLSPALIVLAGIVLSFHVGPMGGLAVLGVGLLALLAAWIRQWSSEFAVTNRRVIIKTGWISRRTIELNMSKVESVEVAQDIVARLLGYGTIMVIGTGGTREPFSLINDPLGFRRAVQSQQT
ncbi:MAG: putative Permease of the major facilitator superfamily [Alphaproteobacteria bacterium]|nr:putative Permease of the major facilitator superfamily [Alphaproteobacteria bacterium]MDB5739727.1 putative Permease of the major facilitator superfamily [Alphaproteobacteria bacterium]